MLLRHLQEILRNGAESGGPTGLNRINESRRPVVRSQFIIEPLDRISYIPVTGLSTNQELETGIVT